MLKRTKGRILLTMLVITGLAGTVNDTSMSNKERKLVVTRLKDSKTVFIDLTKALTEKQLDFVSRKNGASICTILYKLEVEEAAYWSLLEATVKKPSKPEMRQYVTLTDEAVQHLPPSVEENVNSNKPGKPRSFAEIVSTYKTNKTQQLRYVRNTTSDLRNRFVDTAFGSIDCYQFILFMTSRADRRFQEVRQIMATPGFPAN